MTDQTEISGFDCPRCGHRHQGERFACICIGCPCEVVGLTAPVAPGVLIRKTPQIVVDDDEPCESCASLSQRLAQVEAERDKWKDEAERARKTT